MGFAKVNIEVRSCTFGGERKMPGCEEGNKLFIYWKLALIVCNY